MLRHQLHNQSDIDDSVFIPSIPASHTISVQHPLFLLHPISPLRWYLISYQMAEEKKYNETIFSRAFDAYDKDRSESISSKELGKVFESMGIIMEEEKLTELINQADSDGNGRVSKAEFLKFTEDPAMAVVRM